MKDYMNTNKILSKQFLSYLNVCLFIREGNAAALTRLVVGSMTHVPLSVSQGKLITLAGVPRGTSHVRVECAKRIGVHDEQHGTKQT